MKRRDFFKIGTMLAAASAVNASSMNNFLSRPRSLPGNRVNFLGEGLALTPVEYTNLLLKMADEGKIKPDYYSNGGIVEELEYELAALLGKERAVFFPTGTLANHIAIRKLCMDKKRAVVQEESHIYNDSGDCVQVLSNINLIPLGKESAYFEKEDLEKTIKKTATGRVSSPFGAISIETPVRRKRGEIFGFEKIQSIAALARENSIGMHMDGARMFVEAAIYNRSTSDYAPFFDTIYTSLYKCFNSGSGAILAGSEEFCTGLYHTRRMFGGGLPAAWPFAAIALNFIKNYTDEFILAYKNARELFNQLNKGNKVKVTPVLQGTNLFVFEVLEGNLSKIGENLEKNNIFIRTSERWKATILALNPSLNRVKNEDLISIFESCIN